MAEIPSFRPLIKAEADKQTIDRYERGFCRVGMVPRMPREALGRVFHRHDLERLRTATEGYGRTH